MKHQVAAHLVLHSIPIIALREVVTDIQDHQGILETNLVSIHTAEGRLRRHNTVTINRGMVNRTISLRSGTLLVDLGLVHRAFMLHRILDVNNNNNHVIIQLKEHKHIM